MKGRVLNLQYPSFSIMNIRVSIFDFFFRELLTLGLCDFGTSGVLDFWASRVMHFGTLGFVDLWDFKTICDFATFATWSRVSKWRHQTCQMTSSGHHKSKHPFLKSQLFVKKHFTWKFFLRHWGTNTSLIRDIEKRTEKIETTSHNGLAAWGNPEDLKINHLLVRQDWDRKMFCVIGKLRARKLSGECLDAMTNVWRFVFVLVCGFGIPYSFERVLLKNPKAKALLVLELGRAMLLHSWSRRGLVKQFFFFCSLQEAW